MSDPSGHETWTDCWWRIFIIFEKKEPISDEEQKSKVGKKSDLKKEEILALAPEEYIWKLTTKLLELRQRFKKYS